MKTGKRAEKLQYWQAMNQTYETSGLSLKAFCLLQNIHYKSFLNYRYRMKQQNLVSLAPLNPSPSALFVPVEIKASPSMDEAQIRVASPVASNLSTSSAAILVLQLRNTIQLQIPIEVANKNLLRTIFSVLEVV